MTGIWITFEEHCSISLCCSLSLVCLIILWSFHSAVIIMHHFAPDVHRLYLPFSEPTACATTSLLPLPPIPLFYETPIMPYYFMYHLTFSILCPFTLRVGGSVSQDYYQVVSSLKGNSSIRDRNLSLRSCSALRFYEGQGQIQGKPETTCQEMPECSWWHSFSQSVSGTDGILWVWCWYIQT